MRLSRVQERNLPQELKGRSMTREPTSPPEFHFFVLFKSSSLWAANTAYIQYPDKNFSSYQRNS